MAAERFVAQLNEQIAHEFGAELQNLACAVYFESRTLPQLAEFFYRQATSKHEHALRMIRYLSRQGAPAVLSAVAAPMTDFDSVSAPVEEALEAEMMAADQVNQLSRIARDEGDYASEVFMHWFVRQQIEVVSALAALSTVIERSAGDPETIESYVAREHREVPAH